MMGLGLGLSLARIAPCGAAALPSFNGTLYLDFVNGIYMAGTTAGSATARTLAQLVTGAVTPTASGMLIGASDNVTVPLSPAVLSGTWFDNTAGTFYAEAVIAYVNGTFPRIFELGDGSDNNRLIARYDTTADIGAIVTLAGSDTELLNTPYSQTVKLAIAYDATGFASCLNGGTVNTSTTVVPTLTVCQLGNRTTTQNRQLDGNLKAFQFFPSRLSSGALQTLTT